MVLEVVATGSCNGMELVIGQRARPLVACYRRDARMAELSAGCCKGVVKAVIRIVHLIDLEHCFQAPFIETGIVGHKRDRSYLVVDIIDRLVREKHICNSFLQLLPYF